jgi:hypothetical protein
MSYTVQGQGLAPHFVNMNTKYFGERDGVLYRQVNLGGPLATIDLADVLLPGGVLRVDRIRFPFAHKLWLGHYGLPHIGDDANIQLHEIGDFKAITATAHDRRLALVSIHGWDEVSYRTRSGLSAEIKGDSTILFAHRETEQHYPGMGLCITLMLHRLGNDEWTLAELDVIDSVSIQPFSATGSPLGVHLRLRDGREVNVDYAQLEGAGAQ